MKTWTLGLALADYSRLSELKEHQPDVIIVFAPQALLKDSSFISFCKHEMANAPLIGCSTSGEIFGDRTQEDTIVAIGMKFKHTAVTFARTALTSANDSYEAGVEIARQLHHPDLKAIFTLSLGVNMNGSAYVRGIQENVPAGVVISGGLAGDGIAFKDTYTLLAGDISNHHAVAFGLVGDAVCVTSGSAGGWEPFGPQRRVTQCDKSVLYELDNKPALPMYMQYIGDNAQKLPSSALMFPFAIIDESGKGTGLIRTILDVNNDKESIIFAGELPPQGMVCLMHSDTDMLVNGAIDAAKLSLPSQAKQAQLIEDCATILVSCVGRKLVMGEDVDEEILAVHKELGHECTMVGFYSFGEICELAGTSQTHFHNQTMTITHIFETAKDNAHA